jgi:hypothetical protein
MGYPGYVIYILYVYIIYVYIYIYILKNLDTDIFLLDQLLEYT